jgi:hypothetical protein
MIDGLDRMNGKEIRKNTKNHKEAVIKMILQKTYWLEDCFLELVGGCSKLGYLSVCQEVLLSGLCHKEETVI